MKNTPVYDDIIIVGIFYKNEFNWYIADKYIWIMDLKKFLNNIELEKLSDESVYYKIRKDIITLSEKNVEIFLDRLRDYKVDTNLLRLEIFNEIIKRGSNLDLEDYYPVLMLDFNKKILYSQYPEPIEFEKYIPNDWKGKYESFIEYVDLKDRYWIYKGKNIFE